jgi:hypothetical protein
MNVRELIEVLQSWPNHDDQVYLSSDAEGNDFAPVDAVEYGWMSESGQYLRDADDEPEATDFPVLLIFPQ